MNVSWTILYQCQCYTFIIGKVIIKLIKQYIQYIQLKKKSDILKAKVIYEWIHLNWFFFQLNQDLNWEHLAERKVPPPFVPKISHELDVGNFATEFTNMAPQDSPAAVPMNVEKMFKVLTLQIISHVS